MKEKRNNNLIKLTFDTGEVRYFTSENRAAKFIGKQMYNIVRAIQLGDKIEYSDRGPCKAELIDGSKIPYELIN